MRRVWAGLACVLATLLGLGSAAAAEIRVVNLDGPDEGFNDPSAWAPRGGNAGYTLGRARLLAFERAMKILGERLVSKVTIVVEASMDPLETCNSSTAVLGQAGANTVHENFLGGKYANTWYPQALANSLAGVDMAPQDADIFAVFNSTVDTMACLGATDWYYGLDGNPGRDIDFVSVVLHEFTHGLGFVSLVDAASGAKFMGHDDVFMRLLQNHGARPPSFPSMTDAARASASMSDPNLHWVGSYTNDAARALLDGGLSSGHVRMNGPFPLRLGSSVSHFSPELSPNQLMEPSYGGSSHRPDLAVAALRDIGWQTVNPVPLWGRKGSLALGALLLLVSRVPALSERRPRRRSIRSMPRCTALLPR